MRSSILFLIIVLLFSLCAPANLHVYARSFSQEANSPNPAPESGFLSPQKYTNSFFGFSIPLPADAVLNEKTFSLTRGPRQHLLLAFHSPNKELVSFTITATEVAGDPEKEAKQAANLAEMSKSKEVQIGGRQFWTAESPRSKAGGGVKTALFITAMHGYVLEFKIVTFNVDTMAGLEQSIERVSFFDPSTSKSAAGMDSKPYTPGASPFPASAIGRLNAGSVLGNSYSNEDLGFRYEFPRDWVLMSKAPGKQSSPITSQFLLGNSPADQIQHDAANVCTKQLLFVRHYLENPSSGQFNPMIVLIAADPRCISMSPFPRSVDDGDAVQRVARDTIAYFRNKDLTLVNPARVRAFRTASGVMMDISQNFTLSVPGQAVPLNVLSSTLMMKSGDYWVIWLFAAGDKEGLDELRTTKIFPNDAVAPK
jgi:hypothetical protein